MASLSLLASKISSFGQCRGRTLGLMRPWSPRAFSNATPLNFEASQKSKDMIEKASNSTEALATKAKETTQRTWSAVNETTQKATDTAIGAAQDSKESIKENARVVKKCMNTKN